MKTHSLRLLGATKLRDDLQESLAATRREYRMDWYRPNASQARFHHEVAVNLKPDSLKVVSFTAGYGTGKTRAAAHAAVDLAIANPGCIGLLVSPSFTVAEMQGGMLSMLREICRRAGIPHNYNEQHRRLTLEPWNSVILLQSAKTRIISTTAAWAVCDEPGDYPNGALAQVRARLRDRKGLCRRLLLTGTPEGFGNDFYRFTEQSPMPNTVRVRGRTLDNIANLSPDYIDGLRASHDARVLEAYLEGRFVNLTAGNVYHAFDRALHVHPVAFDPRREVMLSCDFNVDPMAWNMYQIRSASQLAAPVALQPEVLTVPKGCTITLHRADTEAAANMAADRLLAMGWQRSEPRIYGYPSGRSGSTRSRHSDYDILECTLKQRFAAAGRRLNVMLLAPRSHPSLRDSVNAVNGKLRNALGQAGALIDPDNRELIEDLEQVAWDRDGGIDKSDASRTHYSDELRHLIHRIWPVPARRAGERSY